MKNLALTVGALLAGTTVAFAEMKIGTVDMLLLVRSHRSYESNKKFLAESEAACKTKLDAMKTDLLSVQNEGRKLADELRNPMLSDAAKKSLENRLVDIQNQFIKQQQEMRNEAMRGERELADTEARLLRIQADDIKKTINEFAAEAGYDLVLDGSAALYAKKAYDVTDGVLKKMGVDPAKARKPADKGKEKNESK
ncbi:MAG TPA: hypothetical protein DD637_06905 [Verrucomicrobia bacterium]|nr:hypothetical protein [Verrucomicrobiota bacterium]HCG19373.1 hypothetical protein [Verrucomicrobiota bacterium]